MNALKMWGRVFTHAIFHILMGWSTGGEDLELEASTNTGDDYEEEEEMVKPRILLMGPRRYGINMEYIWY